MTARGEGRSSAPQDVCCKSTEKASCSGARDSFLRAGAHGPQVEAHPLRRAASLIPGARLVVLEGSNHILQAGEPALEQFLDAMAAFLAESRPTTFPRTLSPEVLTLREKDVLELIARGADNATIARQLFLSPSTIRNHITRIFASFTSRRVGKRLCSRAAPASVRTDGPGQGLRSLHESHSPAPAQPQNGTTLPSRTRRTAHGRIFAEPLTSEVPCAVRG